MNLLKVLAVLSLTLAAAVPARAVEVSLSPELQAKIDACLAPIKAWAADPAIVAAVAAHNAQLPPEHAAMDQAKWKSLSLLDPFVHSFSKNEAAAVLKAGKTDWLTEAVLSDAKGLKVAFLAKPSNWSHAGSPKHDKPMAGRTWQGPVLTDETTGQLQLQLSVPVLKEGNPIGSLVVGVNPAKL